ncbi:MAG: translation initiation factor [Alkalinema sp. RU_4_3]|nr:translation initiation factor [Alkalinema sp. RU_4_3]
MGKKDQVVYREFGDEPEAADETVELPPNQQQVRIQVSRKGKGGKTVTIVSGFVLSAESLAALAKKLKNQCGSGGSVQGETIEIQGDHAQKLLQVLVGLEYKAKISGG